MQMNMIFAGTQFINMNRLAIHDPQPFPIGMIQKVKVIYFFSEKRPIFNMQITSQR